MVRVRTRGARPGDEAGFTIVESLVALVLVFVVMAGAVTTIGLGSRSLRATRERTGATQLAADELARARAAPYATVGHAVASDPTLDDDPDVVAGAGSRTYQGEALVDAGSSASLPAHAWNRMHDGVRYVVRAYVTVPPAALCAACKRVTVAASWGDDAVFGTGTSSSVVLSTILGDRG